MVAVRALNAQTCRHHIIGGGEAHQPGLHVDDADVLRVDLVTQCAGTTITVSPQCPLVANTLGRWLLGLADSCTR